jgi:copper chaperone CopZ
MQKIEGALKSLDGIDKDTMKVLFNSSKVKVNFDEEKLSIDEIESAITKLGYEVIKTKVKQELIKRINLLKKNAKVNF